MNDNFNSSENVVEEKNQPESQESLTNWDEESLAKLLGYDDSENKDNTVSETEIETIDKEEPKSKNEQEESDGDVSDSNNNVVDTHELFDDPHNGKTQPTFATNPFAKFGAVGFILLVVFGTGATFLNTIISGKPRTAPLISDKKPEKPKVLFKENTKPIENENGKLKAELALSTQREKIKSVSSESENTKTPIPKTDSQAPQKLNKANINTNRKSTDSVERPPVVSRPPVYRTIPRRTVQNNYPARSYKSNNKVLPSALPKATINPNPPLTTSPLRRISPPSPPPTTEKPSEIDPKQQWLAVNQLGSYGTAQITPFTEEKNEQKSQEEVKPAVDEKPVLPRTIPSATPLMVSQTDEKATYPEPLHKEEAKILNAECFYNESCSLSEQIVTQLKIGTTVAGRLTTSLMWDKSSNNNTNSKQPNFNPKENFIIQTTEPLKDKNGVSPQNFGVSAVLNVNCNHKKKAAAQLGNRYADLTVPGRGRIVLHWNRK